MSKSTPIKIHVLSEIRSQHDHEKETIEVTTTGEYFLKGKTIYIRYEEKHELGSVKTTVKIAENDVVIIRSGAVTMKQRFTLGTLTLTDYSIPFGKLQLETYTQSLSFDQHELEGKLIILYDLKIAENETHVHKLMMTYKEEQK
jgi:uncharacterized beta-barrel protein YwiB (DUF1934 family)